MRPQGDKSAVDRAVARLASRQHRVATLAELEACGLGRRGVSHRAAAGALRRLHRNVYAIGPGRLTQHGVWLAAVRACGSEAALSHQSAGQLMRILRLPDHPAPVHVTVPGTKGIRQREGVVVHRSSTLARGEVMLRDGVPVTKPERTLLDLRRVLSLEEWEDAVDRARFLSLPIGALPSTEPTRSRFERRILALCRRHRLPKPDVNARVGAFLVDFLWREERLVVEADGYEDHRHRGAFESDRARDAELRLLGYTVVRFTWRQVARRAEGVAGTIRRLLAR